MELTYKNHCVGEGYADLLVGEGADAIVVELKATAGKTGRNEAQQLRNYMERLNVGKGLLINFQKLGDTKEPRETEPEFVEVYPEERAAQPDAGDVHRAAPTSGEV